MLITVLLLFFFFPKIFLQHLTNLTIYVVCDEYGGLFTVLQTTTNHYWWEVCFFGAHGIIPSVRAKRICSTERCGEWLGPSPPPPPPLGCRAMPRNVVPVGRVGGRGARGNEHCRRHLHLQPSAVRARGGCVRTGNARRPRRARAPPPPPPTKPPPRP